jgi:glycosyltransferase involved in cell wall biosynthesis
MEWHLITAEYPPQIGGVSDYTHLVAAGLAAQGDDVHVWCPACPGTQLQEQGPTVHRELGAISPADLLRVGQQLDRFPAPRRILVQWVPHGFGHRSMNLAFCCWLWNRAARHGDRVEIMLHEPYLSFRVGSLRQNVAALVHRLMAILLLRASERVWVSIPEWEKFWRPYALGRRVPFKWLPIPSSIPVADNPGSIQAVRYRYVANDGVLIGHFGSYGDLITALLEPVLFALADSPANQRVLLMGVRSKEFRHALIRKEPRIERMVQATDALAPEDLSYHVAACDLLIQPYPDGVSSRRTSFMVGLCHGKPIVSTTGALSEPFWKDTGALALAPVGDVTSFVNLILQLGTDACERARIATAARTLYRDRFDIAHTIVRLRQTTDAIEPSICVF